MPAYYVTEVGLSENGASLCQLHYDGTPVGNPSSLIAIGLVVEDTIQPGDTYQEEGFKQQTYEEYKTNKTRIAAFDWGELE